MSWFKKIVSRILGDEIEETSTKNNANNNYNEEQQYKSFDEYENGYEYEYEQENLNIEDNYVFQQPKQSVQSAEPHFIRKRESFKFPMIPDENTRKEQRDAQNKEVDIPNWIHQEELNRPLRKQNPLKTEDLQPQTFNSRPRQYSPFVREPRGLKGVVPKTSREDYNPFNPNSIQHLHSNKKDTMTKSNDKVIIEPVKPSYVPKKKKFVPTEVPSPIYGFQKRPKKGRSIYDLLDEKEKEQSILFEEVAVTSIQDKKEDSSSKGIHGNLEAAPTIEENSKTPTTIDESETNIHVDELTVQQGSEEKSEVFEGDDLHTVLIDGKSGQVQKTQDKHIDEETDQIGEQSLISAEESGKSEVENSLENLKQVPSFENDVDDSHKKIEDISSEINPDSNNAKEIKKELEISAPKKDLLPYDSTIEVGQKNLLQTNEESMEIVTSNTNQSSEEVEKESVEEPKKSGSRIPFNVVMLKSDKERIEKLSSKSMPLSNQATSYSNTPELLENNTREDFTKSVTETVKEEPSSKPVEISPTKVEFEPQEQEIKTNELDDTLKKQSNMIEEQEPPVLNKHLEEAISYLEPPEEQTEDFEWMDVQGEKLIEALSYFQIEGEIVQIVQGPAVTQFEITVGHGVKVSKIRNLADDLKLALAAKDIRIQAPIPGKSSIGIEIPNRKSRPVRLSEVVTHSSFVESKSPLEAALGLDLTGEPVTIDLRKMPHGMIAGATGSGKSVCINSLLISLLLKASPQDVKLMLIDPKMVELAPFNHIPHLVSPVITDVKAATAALKWAVEEMDRRYQLFAHVGARDITRYNKMVEKERKFSLKMPYLVIVIDELADLMMMSPQEVEESICRIAQKARACGIHLVLATQRPSVDVITGLIKSNIPTRIAFSVSSNVDSRTILDSQGAERLLGRGDMLYLGNGMSAPVRVQGTFVTDEEIEAVTNFVRSLGEPDYLFEQEELLKKVDSIDEQDELFEEACRYICSEGSVSASSLQRKYRIGYNRAARLVDMMEAQGFISESKGTKPRDVFLSEHDIEEIFGSNRV